MTPLTRRYTLALAIFVSILNTGPAAAMGRSGAPTVQPTDHQTAARLGRVESEQKSLEVGLQAQVEALRKELAELKAKVAASDGIATAQ